MEDKDKTQKQLIRELTQLRQRIAALEATGRKRNQFEESLRTERDKAQQYLDIAEVILVVLNKMGTITLINRKGNQILGYPEGELIGKNWFTTCLPTYLRKDVKGVFKKLMAGKGKQTEFYENPVLTKSGTERIIAWHNTILKDAQGTIIGTLSSGEDITERKRVEEEIERLASFPKLNPMPIVEVDQKGRLTYTNTAAQQIFPDLDKRQGEHPFLAGLKSYFPELQQKKRKYLVREVEVGSDWYSQIISLADPEYIRIYATDITKRKRVEDTLRETSLFLRSILDSSSSISIVFTDLEQNILFWNKGAENIFGYKAEEVVGRHTVDILYPDEGDTKQTVEEIRSYILNKKRGVRREIKEITKDGRILWISLTSTPRFNENGNVIGILGIGEDITGRKQIEEEKRASEKRYKTLFNSASDAVFIVNMAGQFIDVNEVAYKRLGYRKEELLQMTPMGIDSPEYASLVQKRIKTVCQQGYFLFETVQVRRDGTPIPTEISSRVIEYDGKPAVLSIARDITDRKQVEEALRASEEQFRQFFENEPEYCYMISPEGLISNVNNAALNALEYTKEELVGKPLQTIYAPESLLKMERLYSKWKKSGQLKDEEMVIITKKGERRTVLLSAGAVKDSNGNILHSISVQKDISERKNIEDALKESEERFRRVIETMEVGLGTIDENGVLTYVNEYLAKMLGYSISEMIGRSTLDFYYDEESRQVQREIFKKRRAGMRDPTPYEVTWRRKDGQKVYSILSPTPLFDANGHYTGSFAIHTDITELKQAEEALRESAEQYRILTNTAMDGFLNLDLEGHILDVNKVYCDLLDYSKEELLKMTIGDIEAKETPDKVKKHLKKVKDVGSDRFESFLRRKDGRIIDVEISLTSLPQSDHILVFVRDISDRKQAEEELKRSYQQMQDMLVTTVNALASTVEMKDQYTAGHQPRVTQLACAIAEEMGLSKEQIEGIRMAGLIHDIGKIMVPAEILNKPGPLTEIQYEMVKMHPQAGYDILKDIKFPWPVAQMVLQHHELMDGSGYPQGLSGEEIMVEARILTVANVIEAMVSHRPYRDAHDIKEALAEILKNKGILYDPVVVDACEKLFAKKRFSFEETQ